MKGQRGVIKRSATLLFEQGLYTQIVDQLESSVAARATSSSQADLTAKIGAHSFLGNLDEALSLWKSVYKQLEPSQAIKCRFYLGVALTRTFRIEEGKLFFDDNLKSLDEVPKQKKFLSESYLYQGLGFYHYFLGQFFDAIDWAEKAHAASAKSKDRYAHFLATDLLGHCKVQLGNRSQGVRLISSAGKLAEKNGNRNVSAALKIAVLIYQAEGGERPLTILDELESELLNLSASDSFTRGNLILEIARQRSLRGRWKSARELLNIEAHSIYSYGNRRQELMLQLRLAEVAFRQGDRFGAEHFIRSARRCLHDVADRLFEIRILDFELKLAMGSEIASSQTNRLIQLSQGYPSNINQQMVSRKVGLSFKSELDVVPETNDPIHRLFLLANQNPKAAMTQAIDIGHLGLWAQFAGEKPGALSCTILDDGQSIILNGPGGVFIKSRAIGLQSLKILNKLSQGLCTKEKLIGEVWGYVYHPLHHNPLIYTAITKLRKMMFPYSEWIVTSEQGWMLNPVVSLRLGAKMDMHDSHDAKVSFYKKVERMDVHSVPGADRLNFRQLKLIELVGEEKSVYSIGRYKKEFGVSTMTAFRDLDTLRSLKFLLRTGKGRATRYHLSQSTSG